VTSFDPFLVVDHRTGRIFSVNFLGDGQPTCATISHTDDNGNTWSSFPTACDGFDGESIGTGPPATTKPIGYPDIVYYCTGTTPTSAPPTTTPICSKSLDGGVTFVPTGNTPWPGAESDAAGDTFGPWAGNPVVGPDGTVYIPKRFAGQPELAVSRDEGLTWTRRRVATDGSGGETPRMAVDNQGDLVYAWTNAHHAPEVAFSRDHGQRWSAPIPLAPPGVNEGVLPRPAITADGRVAVAWVGTTDSPGPPYSAYCDILLSPCDDGLYAHVGWNGYLTLIANIFSARPRLYTATVNRRARRC
jgi:hypothetical protein